jgi:hypothetical protein
MPGDVLNEAMEHFRNQIVFDSCAFKPYSGVQ